MNSTISRRTFLAGASTAAASALVASSAIAEEAKSEQADAQAESALAADELLYTASINPQDSDWLGTETDFATLFSPWKLGNIELSHRMVKPLPVRPPTWPVTPTSCLTTTSTSPRVALR